MKIKWIYLLAGIVLSLSFIAFTYVVRSDILRQFDFDMTVKIQDRIPDKIYEYLHLVSLPAGFGIMTTLLIITLAVSRNWLRLASAFIVYGAAHVLELIGKMILSQPPPQFMFYKLQSGAWFPDNYQPEGNSYPSGHSFRAFYYAVLISVFLINKNAQIPKYLKLLLITALIGFAFSVALAKVALGQHWATDVIAGFLLGAGTAFIASSIEFIGRDRSSSRNISDK